MKKREELNINILNSSRILNSAKSQVALEFMMTYGWGIMIALVSVSAIAYFVNGPGSDGWGAWGSGCWSGHPGGCYCANTDGGYGCSSSQYATTTCACASNGGTVSLSVTFCSP